MSLVLNTNINSLVAQNSLTSSGTQLATALQQLSSGLRINTAADDAAGYAIVQGMTSQINGLNQAAQNANDGVSLTQTAQGALTEITNDLQTMRDLAVESLNATNSAPGSCRSEPAVPAACRRHQQRRQRPSFNGVNLLDGSFQGATSRSAPTPARPSPSPRSPVRPPARSARSTRLRLNPSPPVYRRGQPGQRIDQRQGLGHDRYGQFDRRTRDCHQFGRHRQYHRQRAGGRCGGSGQHGRPYRHAGHQRRPDGRYYGHRHGDHGCRQHRRCDQCHQRLDRRDGKHQHHRHGHHTDQYVGNPISVGYGVGSTLVRLTPAWPSPRPSPARSPAPPRLRLRNRARPSPSTEPPPGRSPSSAAPPT